MDKETLQKKLDSLGEQHKELKLDLMEADANHDDILAAQIKKNKLQLKDQIEIYIKQLENL
jgi:hypothetical protein